jgi:predicted enzyme related to lactoylglutathione lyase
MKSNMRIKYAHTNIISNNWKKLADFYVDVFACKPVPPIRDLTGEWLAKGTGVVNAKLQGVHLRLPGHGDSGPTLEIYSYDKMLEKPKPAANRMGFGHLAFEVDDVKEILQNLISNGGDKLGEVVEHKVEGVGMLTFTYATDPEGNIIEIQNWKDI